MYTTASRSKSSKKLSSNVDYYQSRGSVYSEDLDEAGKFLKMFDTRADFFDGKKWFSKLGV